MCKELKFSKKISLKTVGLNIDYFEKEIDMKLVKFLKKSYVKNDYLLMIKRCYFDKTLIVDSFKCIVCDRPIKANKEYFSKTCGDDGCKRKLYASQKGKKRPEHAKKMSKIVKEKIEQGLFWGEEHRKNNKKHINSVEMKRTELINKGVIDSSDVYSDSEICELLSNERRKTKLSIERKTQELKSFLQNVEYMKSPFFIKGEYDKLSSIEERVKYKNSVISQVSKINNPNMGGYGFAGGFFKSSIINNLKHNERGLTIVETKSSYETNFINFFEEQGIIWDYEPEVIFLKYNNYKRKTIPDFYLYSSNGGKLQKVIEVKGFIDDYDEMVEKVYKTKKYYESIGVPYYFCKMGNISSMDEINEWSCFNKTLDEIDTLVKKGK